MAWTIGIQPPASPGSHACSTACKSENEVPLGVYRTWVKSVEIAGPGFLNIRLDAAAAGALARDIVQAGAEYGHTGRLTGQRINLEFVSANPTGPVHIGGVRWAAVGDALSRLLRAAGATVGTVDVSGQGTNTLTFDIQLASNVVFFNQAGQPDEAFSLIGNPTITISGLPSTFGTNGVQAAGCRYQPPLPWYQAGAR